MWKKQGSLCKIFDQFVSKQHGNAFNKYFVELLNREKSLKPSYEGGTDLLNIKKYFVKSVFSWT